MILTGDCLEILKTLPDDSVDSCVTDPPYELGFMGKKWDNTGIAYNVEMWKEVLRVLKPGGHLLSFSGSRTYHRMAVAIEDAGFDIRDQIMWVYGSGFPKSLNIGKAVDKLQGNKREITGTHETHDIRNNALMDRKGSMTVQVTKGTSQWEGWGTALKPAHEPIVVARKPLGEKTVAENCLKWGVGGINIDECRVGTEGGGNNGTAGCKDKTRWRMNAYPKYAGNIGRFPANLIHDGSEEVLECFPTLGKSSGGRIGKKAQANVTNVPYGKFEKGNPGFGDSGSAARFFYCAKASKKDRDDGLEGFEEKVQDVGNLGVNSPESRVERGRSPEQTKVKNNHPTVKPTELMRYLVKLVTPRGGIVLDPFTGSGSTGKACQLEGFEFIGIEREEEYVKIAEARIEAVNQVATLV